MNETRIILLCSSRFAFPAMRDMVFHRQLAVVGIPEHCEEMIGETTALLTGTGIPVLKLDKDNLDAELKKAMKKYEVSLGFVMTFPFRISPGVYTTPVKGFFNVHPGPLPEYRGADPVFQQVKNRERQAGVTIHKLAEKMDRGETVIREMINTDPRDTYGLLNNKLSELAAKLTGIIIKMAALDIAIPSRPQDETKARYFKRQSAKDISIRWDEMDADAIIALANACNPWNKGAVTKLNHKIIRVIGAEKYDPSKTPSGTDRPGQIVAFNEDGILVSTINAGLLKIGFIYVDEGFINAARLAELGFVKGNIFETI